MPRRIVVEPSVIKARAPTPAVAAEGSLERTPATVRTYVKTPGLGVVPPIAGGDASERVPPRVRLPEVVTVPERVRPLTGPVPPTEGKVQAGERGGMAAGVVLPSTGPPLPTT